MQLSKRPSVYTLPSYSLTGDLLGFLRCGLQYRYTSIGKLPSSRPVQAWFGQFIHGVLEESYRRFNLARKKGVNDLPPWSEEQITEICDLIKRRLAVQKLLPWSDDLEEIGYARAKVAINEMGPQLFPLIHRAEVRLTDARILPIAKIPQECRFREADRYEITGIVDVITHFELNNPSLQNNQLLQVVLESLPAIVPNEFEIIIDYKGMRRPPITSSTQNLPSFWDIYGWQAQTYAHLRSKQEDSSPVVAGIIIYLNELLPTKDDLKSLLDEIENGTTDILPTKGGEAEYVLSRWNGRNDLPTLPLEFRLRRALRVLQVKQESINTALEEFDNTVARIETCRGRELIEGKILSSWESNPGDEDTCIACDARTFCPSYKSQTKPRLPGKRQNRP